MSGGGYSKSVSTLSLSASFWSAALLLSCLSGTPPRDPEDRESRGLWCLKGGLIGATIYFYARYQCDNNFWSLCCLSITIVCTAGASLFSETNGFQDVRIGCFVLIACVTSVSVLGQIVLSGANRRGIALALGCSASAQILSNLLHTIGEVIDDFSYVVSARSSQVLLHSNSTTAVFFATAFVFGTCCVLLVFDEEDKEKATLRLVGLNALVQSTAWVYTTLAYSLVISVHVDDDGLLSSTCAPAAATLEETCSDDVVRGRKLAMLQLQGAAFTMSAIASVAFSFEVDGHNSRAWIRATCVAICLVVLGHGLTYGCSTFGEVELVFLLTIAAVFMASTVDSFCALHGWFLGLVLLYSALLLDTLVVWVVEGTPRTFAYFTNISNFVMFVLFVVVIALEAINWWVYSNVLCRLIRLTCLGATSVSTLLALLLTCLIALYDGSAVVELLTDASPTRTPFVNETTFVYRFIVTHYAPAAVWTLACVGVYRTHADDCSTSRLGAWIDLAVWYFAPAMAIVCYLLNGSHPSAYPVSSDTIAIVVVGMGVVALPLWSLAFVAVLRLTNDVSRRWFDFGVVVSSLTIVLVLYAAFNHVPSSDEQTGGN